MSGPEPSHLSTRPAASLPYAFSKPHPPACHSLPTAAHDDFWFYEYLTVFLHLTILSLEFQCIGFPGHRAESPAQYAYNLSRNGQFAVNKPLVPSLPLVPLTSHLPTPPRPLVRPGGVGQCSGAGRKQTQLNPTVDFPASRLLAQPPALPLPLQAPGPGSLPGLWSS